MSQPALNPKSRSNRKPELLKDVCNFFTDIESIFHPKDFYLDTALFTDNILTLQYLVEEENVYDLQQLVVSHLMSVANVKITMNLIGKTLEPDHAQIVDELGFRLPCVSLNIVCNVPDGIDADYFDPTLTLYDVDSKLLELGGNSD